MQGGVKRTLLHTQGLIGEVFDCGCDPIAVQRSAAMKHGEHEHVECGLG
jgi:hypothetical protein